MSKHNPGSSGRSVLGWAGQGILWGICAGALLGCIYGVLLVIFWLTYDTLIHDLKNIALLPLAIALIAPLALSIGATLGAILGLFIGAANGLLISFLSRIGVAINLNTSLSRRLISGSSSVASLALSLLGFEILRFIFAPTRTWFDFSINFVLYNLLPTIVAGVGSWWVCQRMIKDINRE